MSKVFHFKPRPRPSVGPNAAARIDAARLATNLVTHEHLLVGYDKALRCAKGPAREALAKAKGRLRAQVRAERRQLRLVQQQAQAF